MSFLRPRLYRNYDDRCESCGSTPTVGESGLCGPCFFGEADTAGGFWEGAYDQVDDPEAPTVPF